MSPGFVEEAVKASAENLSSSSLSKQAAWSSLNIRLDLLHLKGGEEVTYIYNIILTMVHKLDKFKMIWLEIFAQWD